MKDPRYKRVDTCKECNSCGGSRCNVAKTEDLRPYQGIRFTADGFDCALPVTIDSHSACSFRCIYCFSENLYGHVKGKSKGLGEVNLKFLEGIFSGSNTGKKAQNIRKALRYDNRNANGYPCPVQLGGINDPGDNIERQQGWFLEFAKLVIKYQQPVRVSTKGMTLALPEYLKVMAEAPHLFWVAFSIISPDDEVIERVDVDAPNATERLATMKALSSIGVSTSLRFRPIFPGISDKTPRYPQAYRALIEKARESGARAISYECGFFPSRIPKDARERWHDLELVSRSPLKQIYASFGKQACTRPSYQWTEQIMHAIFEVAKKQGMTIGVSDPVWKQLSEVGCCCGMPKEDPVFGNWERENATEALIHARDNPDHIITFDEINPPWAKDVLLGEMANIGAGPKTVWTKRRATWEDKLRDVWDNPETERSPYSYFQGAVTPVRLPDGHVGYQYRGLERANKIPPYWSVDTDLSSPCIHPKGKRKLPLCRLSTQCDGTICKKGCRMGK